MLHKDIPFGYGTPCFPGEPTTMAEGYVERIYFEHECAVFCSTKAAYGGLSNMAAGYPLQINGVSIRSAEALYQACRFPHLPEIQQRILDQRSPMTAKMVGKPFRSQTRPDWEQVRVRIMRWCLRVKLVQNWDKFGAVLRSTDDKPIVEKSSRDSFWGAIPQDDGSLVGINALGRLLMELRYVHERTPEELARLVPPLQDFLLLRQPIPVLESTVPAEHASIGRHSIAATR